MHHEGSGAFPMGTLVCAASALLALCLWAGNSKKNHPWEVKDGAKPHFDWMRHVLAKRLGKDREPASEAESSNVSAPPTPG